MGKTRATERDQNLAALCGRFHVEILYVFGSRADEVSEWQKDKRAVLSAGPADVDVGVKIARGYSLSVYDKVCLAQALEDLWGVARVDLVSLSEADPFLAANVIRGERLYAYDQDAADEYDLYVLRRAGDLIPLELERQSLVLEERR